MGNYELLPTTISAPTNKMCHTSAPFPILNRPLPRKRFGDPRERDWRWWKLLSTLMLLIILGGRSLNSKNSGNFRLLQPVEGGMFGTIRMYLGWFFPLKIREKWWDNMGWWEKKEILQDTPAQLQLRKASQWFLGDVRVMNRKIGFGWSHFGRITLR